MMVRYLYEHMLLNEHMNTYIHMLLNGHMNTEWINRAKSQVLANRKLVNTRAGY